MGVFNNWEYNAKEEAARRAENLACLEDSKVQEQQEPLENILFDLDILTAKIENHKGFYSADCPNCGKTKILSSELNSMTAVCNKCYCTFNLEN